MVNKSRKLTFRTRPFTEGESVGSFPAGIWLYDPGYLQAAMTTNEFEAPNQWRLMVGPDGQISRWLTCQKDRIVVVTSGRVFGFVVSEERFKPSRVTLDIKYRRCK